MVEAVHSGESQRAVARRFKVSLATVQHWVTWAGDHPLDQVDWSGRSPGRPIPVNRTDPDLERLVVETRHRLKTESILGEYGAEAIRQELQVTHPERSLPSVRTIGRILERQGVLDGKYRVRRPPPPPGWYLPPVAAHQAELDQFDLVEELKIKDGPLVDVLTGVSLNGGLAMARAGERFTAERVRRSLLGHWQEVGLPDYVQFDNDTVFQGPHQHPDVIGSVTRLCLRLGVTVVFTPPREVGFQAAIERFNGLWQSKVWRRYHHPSLMALQERSDRYIASHRSRSAQRQESAPSRHPFPEDTVIDLRAMPQGTVVYIRRTTDTGQVSVLGHTFPVDPDWPRRLVRCEVDLAAHCIRFYRLRRREPAEQPLMQEIPYHLPKRSFRVSGSR